MTFVEYRTSIGLQVNEESTYISIRIFFVSRFEVNVPQHTQTTFICSPYHLYASYTRHHSSSIAGDLVCREDATAALPACVLLLFFSCVHRNVVGGKRDERKCKYLKVIGALHSRRLNVEEKTKNKVAHLKHTQIGLESKYLTDQIVEATIPSQCKVLMVTIEIAVKLQQLLTQNVIAQKSEIETLTRRSRHVLCDSRPFATQRIFLAFAVVVALVLHLGFAVFLLNVRTAFAADTLHTE